MSENILIILSNNSQQSLRNKLINDFCKNFGETCLKNQKNIEIIDLSSDLQTKTDNPNETSDSKIIEYQIKIQKADKIVVFHSTTWQNIPPNLANFLNKVLTNGFAYERVGGQIKGLLHQKLLILAFGESSNFEHKVIFGNILQNFWQRAISNPCGFECEFCYFGDFRKADESETLKWQQKIQTLATKYSSDFSFGKLLNQK